MAQITFSSSLHEMPKPSRTSRSKSNNSILAPIRRCLLPYYLTAVGDFATHKNISFSGFGFHWMFCRLAILPLIVDFLQPNSHCTHRAAAVVRDSELFARWQPALLNPALSRQDDPPLAVFYFCYTAQQ